MLLFLPSFPPPFQHLSPWHNATHCGQWRGTWKIMHQLLKVSYPPSEVTPTISTHFWLISVSHSSTPNFKAPWKCNASPVPRTQTGNAGSSSTDYHACLSRFCTLMAPIIHSLLFLLGLLHKFFFLNFCLNNSDAT